MTYTFIIATTRRRTLYATLESIKPRAGDQVLVVTDQAPKFLPPYATFVQHPKGENWGAAERNHALTIATGDMISFMDDDDIYAENARALLDTVIPGKPHIFKMRYRYGDFLWIDPRIRQGNIGTPMIVVPNDPKKLGRFGNRYEGDFDFLTSCKWNQYEYVFRHEVIANIRPNIP
jgi:hypothetical protein